MQTLARAFVSNLTDAGRLDHELGSGRGGYLYVIDVRVAINGDEIRTGDAAKVSGAIKPILTTHLAAELILIAVPLEFEPVVVLAGER